MNISAVILTRNEEINIKDCIKSISWCSEVIVIDDYSNDNTVEISKSLNAKVYSRNLNGDFGQQRNFGLEKARGEWVLFVDADELVSTELRDEILSVTKTSRSKSFCSFSFRRIDFMWGKELKHGESGSIRLIRMVRKGTGTWKRKVHEEWEGTGGLLPLNNPLLHYPHETVGEFLRDIDFYSTLHAQQKFEEGVQSNLFKILFWPKFKFLNNWIIKLGFLDGTAGFVIAMVMSLHSFLAWSKLWLLKSKS